jgi:hypothetical protein
VAVNRIPAVSWVAQSCFRKISTFWLCYITAVARFQFTT